MREGFTMKQKVLVVDDQPDIRRLVRMTLDIGEFDVYEAATGEMAVESAIAVKPRVVLMDIMMPGSIDGLGACRAIKADPRLRDVSVVMLTARGQQADIEAGSVAGADAYLVKPFSPLQLLDVVNDLIKGAGKPR